jgi:polar amino acid transport system substrate-binding protein
MARTSRLLASVAALAIVASACGGSSSSDTTAASSEKVAAFEPVQAGKLTVCTDAPYEPFEFQAEDGSWTGFDMDIMTKIATANGLTLNVSVQGFDGILLKLAAKECDVVASSVTITEERAQSVDFSNGYFDSFQSLLVRNTDKDTLNSLASLKGKTIAVQTGTTGEAFAKANATGAKIQSYDDASAMFLALESKEVDGVLQDFPINASRAVKQGTSTVSVKFTEGQKAEQYGFAVEKGNASLLTVLNDTLATMKTDGSYDEIFAKYFG